MSTIWNPFARRVSGRQLNDILGTIFAAGRVIPVVTIDRVSDAAPLARALIDGGIRVIEVTLRTEVSLLAIAEIARTVPQAILGAGTILNEKQVGRAATAGAQFLVSPGLSPGLVRAADAVGLPLLPGVATVTDIMHGLDLGLDAFKFFPAEASGGVAMLRAFEGPFPSIMFCPAGGISAANAHHYLSLRNVACVGGSWLAPKEALEAGDWSRITRLAQEARLLRG
jgi:2-dehydro-3-deoxyphosphogluconate aldolase/(4S)-4-hydroxy-2-oxoglutarate aldolase